MQYRWTSEPKPQYAQDLSIGIQFMMHCMIILPSSLRLWKHGLRCSILMCHIWEVFGRDMHYRVLIDPRAFLPNVVIKCDWVGTSSKCICVWYLYIHIKCHEEWRGWEWHLCPQPQGWVSYTCQNNRVKYNITTSCPMWWSYLTLL